MPEMHMRPERPLTKSVRFISPPRRSQRTRQSDVHGFPIHFGASSSSALSSRRRKHFCQSLYYRKSPQSIGIVMRRISSEFTEASNSAYHRPTPQLQILYPKSVISKLKHPSAPTAPFPMQSQEQRLPFAHFRMHLYHAVRSYHTVPFKALKRRKTWTDADFFSSQGLFSPRDRHQATSLRRRRR